MPPRPPTSTTSPASATSRSCTAASAATARSPPGFSFVSILTTVFQLFSFGFGFGGPSFFWTWPIVFVGQILVALCFAELAARYPISGCIYQWATRLGGPLWGWMAGWLMLSAQVVTVAAAAIALEIVLPAIWTGFQIVGGTPTDRRRRQRRAARQHAAGGHHRHQRRRRAGHVADQQRRRDLRARRRRRCCASRCSPTPSAARASCCTPARASGTARATCGRSSSPALMAAYVMVGFDSAGELSEETRRTRAAPPRARSSGRSSSPASAARSCCSPR